MAPANPKTHKDLSLSRVPKDLHKLITEDAKRERLSQSDIIRRILLRHYGMLNGNAQH